MICILTNIFNNIFGSGGLEYLVAGLDIAAHAL